MAQAMVRKATKGESHFANNIGGFLSYGPGAEWKADDGRDEHDERVLIGGLSLHRARLTVPKNGRILLAKWLSPLAAFLTIAWAITGP